MTKSNPPTPTFTFHELRQQLNKQGDRNLTDEEIQCCIDVLEFEGYIKKLSKDLWIKTGKEIPKQLQK
jgi:hypothetical protein